MGQDVNLFRYRERFHMSAQEAMNEPAEEINRAFLIWEMDAERDKLEENRQSNKN